MGPFEYISKTCQRCNGPKRCHWQQIDGYGQLKVAVRGLPEDLGSFKGATRKNFYNTIISEHLVAYYQMYLRGGTGEMTDQLDGLGMHCILWEPIHTAIVFHLNRFGSCSNYKKSTIDFACIIYWPI